MSERTDRHSVLLDLVDDRVVESQAELLSALAAAGLEVHQSTLSRDLRELGIRKVQGRYTSHDGAQGQAGGSTRPASSAGMSSRGGSDGSSPPVLPDVHGYTVCGPNLITVRAGTGQAQLLGVLLDESGEPCIAGTIAGDDTVLVVTKGRREQREALALLEAWFGEGKRDAV